MFNFEKRGEKASSFKEEFSLSSQNKNISRSRNTCFKSKKINNSFLTRRFGQMVQERDVKMMKLTPWH